MNSKKSCIQLDTVRDVVIPFLLGVVVKGCCIKSSSVLFHLFQFYGVYFSMFDLFITLKMLFFGLGMPLCGENRK